MKKSIFLLSFLLFACTEYGDNKPPNNLIPPEQMSKITLDIVLIKNIKRNAYSNQKLKAFRTDQYLFDKYQIDSQQLTSSQEYYAKNPKAYIPIVKEAQEMINKIEDSIQKIVAEFEDQ